jgi:ClpP class serine protease
MCLLGYRLELIKSGKFKAMGIEGTSLTEEQRAFLQADVDKARQWFRSEIRLKRPGVSDETTEGQDYFAADALALDLVDAVAGRAEAMEEARDLASTSRNRK